MTRESKHNHSKGFTQIDYIIATGIFLVVFALVVQYVGNFFSGVVATTNVRIMTTEANDFLGIAGREPIPESWPYIDANSSALLYMHLDNSTLDSSAYANDGVITGANCSANVAGKLDTACSFDGIDDSIDVPYSANLDINNSFTIEAWINLNNYTSGGGNTDRASIVQHTGQYYVTVDSATGKLDTYAAGLTAQHTSSNSSIPLGNWTHVLIGYNGSHLTWYINGALDKLMNVSGAITQDPRSISIGGEPGFGRFLNGSIDEVIIWNRSLSQQEIYERYAYDTTLRRIGLSTRAYRFYIVLNNSRALWINQSKAWTNLTDELVVFNYSDLGTPARVSSTSIYDDNGDNVPYNINGNTITFNSSVAVNTTKNFTVYFDDDANFPERTTSVAGSNNLTERIFPVQSIGIVQYRKIIFLNNSGYAAVKNATQLPRDFRITLADSNGLAVLTFGAQPPQSGNIVATRRFVIYQNATGHIRGGSMNVQVW